MFHSLSLTKLIPPPDFLVMPASGVHLTDRRAVFLLLGMSRGSLVVEHFGEYVIPEGVIEAGEVRDVDTCVELLRKIRKEVKTPFARVALPEQKAYLFERSVPEASFAETKTLIESELEEDVPIAPAEAVFDAEFIPGKGSHAMPSVAVSVVSQKITDQYAQLFTRAGFLPLSFELESQAIARSVVRRGERHPTLVIDFGETRSAVFIVVQGVVEYSSTIEVSGRELASALAKFEQASVSLGGEGTMREHELAEATALPLGALRDEIMDRLRYWHSRPESGGRQVERAILSGGNTLLGGFLDDLTSALSVPVERANVWSNVCSFERYIPPLRAPDALRYAGAIGLSLRSHLP